MDRPPPLRTDGSNAFAYYSMHERVPRIAREVIESNPGHTSAMKRAVERLARDIETNAPLRVPRAPGPDVAQWTLAFAEHAGETWLATQWFYAELAFYRELAHACRFWETGRDPFEASKEGELAGEGPWSRLEEALAKEGVREERIAALLEECLWGNRVDLSYRVAAARVHRQDGDLLVDERSAALPLLAGSSANVHLVADNTGTELALDLALVDAILEEPTTHVTLHLKLQPAFVSDAVPRDVWRLLERMGQRGGGARSLADRLRTDFDTGRLVLAADPFWNGPHFLWDAPAHLHDALGAATIVVFKGDANYRRVVGDALWPPATPFAHACAYLEAPIVCLRTMKSDSVLGLPKGLAERLDTTDVRWRIDGHRGVVQTFTGAARA